MIVDNGNFLRSMNNAKDIKKRILSGLEKELIVEMPYTTKDGLVFDCACNQPHHKKIIDPLKNSKDLFSSISKALDQVMEEASLAVIEKIKNMKISYLEGLKRCGCGQQYSCNFKKGFNEAIDQAIQEAKQKRRLFLGEDLK